MLERTFHIRQSGSTVGREMIGGVVTFMTLCYIIFVQPVVMSEAGIDHAGAFFATCVASAFACFLMAFLANYPIALAPAMGHNFLFTYTICLAMGFTWQQALAANFISGAMFLLLSFVGFREAVMNAVPECLKFSIAAGIGMLIAFLGMQWSGLVVSHPATYVQLGRLSSPVALLSMFGLLVISVLLVLRVRGAILIGIVTTAVVGYVATRVWHLTPALVSYGGGGWQFPSPVKSAFKLDFAGIFTHRWIEVVAVLFILLFLDLFDTIGTLLGVGERAGFLKDGKLPRAGRALVADAAGTVVGTCLGTSTVTSYIESSAGVAAGARTGLANIVTGALLLACLFIYPLVQTVGGAVAMPATALGAPGGGTVFCYPVIAPVLIVVGVFMLGVVGRIKWSDYTQSIPSFLTIIVMMTAFSITDGIAWGFISYTILKIFARQWRQISPLVAVFSVLFVLMYVLRITAMHG